MTAAPWSDHIIEPGADSPLAVLSLAWLAQLRKAMEREYAAREWSRRWKAVARRQRWQSDSNFAWGQQWQEYYRQKDALLAEVMAGYADVVQQVKAERDAFAAALEAIRAVCAGSTNRYASTAWDRADAALARGRAGANQATVTTDTEKQH